MSALVVLIRGINLGPHKRVKMADLRAELEVAGFEDVRTYIASGNVVLRSEDPAAKVGEAVQAVLSKKLGVDAEVMVRTAAQIAQVVEGNPFPDVEDGKKLHVAFLNGAPNLPEGDFAPEAFVQRDELYISLPNGMGESPLMKVLSKRQAGASMTVRNWNTVLALHELSSS